MQLPRTRALAWALVAAVAAAGPACSKGKGGSGGETPSTSPSDLPSGAVPVASAPPTTTATPAAPLVMAGNAPVSFAPIAKKADPSVVTINTIVEELTPDIFGRTRR